MVIVLKPPQAIRLDPNMRAVFLAGSIEMGAAEQWQSSVVSGLSDLDCIILNPRRDAWDASWPQTPDYGPFREQVEWELEAQERADLIGFYFSPTTKAPITLLELGMCARGGKAIVCCPPGFWRKGNVDIVCDRYNVPQVASIADLISSIRARVIGVSSRR